MSDNPYEAPVELEPAVETQEELSNSATALRRAFWFAAVQQFAVLLLAYLGFNGGEALGLVGFMSIVFWCMTAVLLLRRRHNPTKLDILLVKYGIWFPIIIVGAVAR